MTNHRLCMFTFAILTFSPLFSAVSARAVNISNTWMLPEEDFPVFFRYFRDRISWYEADAVCQFHHANLVTADSSSQYDAIRAYLKELDITDNVWIGLSKKTENSEFAWANSKVLTGEGHWREAIPVGGEPLCVTMDPTADFLWKPYNCGGPEAASFICELPVPSWALGQKGCLLTELPSLTVLYLPESMALELTSDCGLDGTKRITCKGNADREEILKQLTCVIPQDEDFEDKTSTKVVSTTEDVTDASTTFNDETVATGFKTTMSWIWTSNSVDGYEMSTRHRRETISPSEGGFSDTKSDVTEPIPSINTATNSNYDTEVTGATVDDSTDVPDGPVDVAAEKPSSGPTQVSLKTVQDPNNRQDEPETTETAETTANADVKAADPLGEDIAEYPSAINQGQLFSIIENGTMFDIIELNDTGIEDVKPTKTVFSKENSRENVPKITTSIPSTTTTTTTSTSNQTKNPYTTVVYYKEAPPEATQVTNKSLKKLDKLQTKTQYYKKSDPKKINYQSEKDQRRNKEEKLNKDLNKEVDMFPVIAPGGPFVKLNRTHRKELPVIEEDETFENSDIINNELDVVEQTHKHAEITLEKKHDANSSDVFIVTTKFVDERNKNRSHNESTTTFSENHNETKLKTTTTTQVPTSILIDPKLDELNKNVSLNNDSEILQDKKDDFPWDKDEEIMSKSLLGEIETITDDVIENNTLELENPTSEPLNSEPITPDRPNRRRKLTNTQRRSFYPYFFSRVLG